MESFLHCIVLALVLVRRPAKNVAFYRVQLKSMKDYYLKIQSIFRFSSILDERNNDMEIYFEIFWFLTKFSFDLWHFRKQFYLW